MATDPQYFDYTKLLPPDSFPVGIVGRCRRDGGAYYMYDWRGDGSGDRAGVTGGTPGDACSGRLVRAHATGLDRDASGNVTITVDRFEMLVERSIVEALVDPSVSDRFVAIAGYCGRTQTSAFLYMSPHDAANSNNRAAIRLDIKADKAQRCESRFILALGTVRGTDWKFLGNTTLVD